LLRSPAAWKGTLLMPMPASVYNIAVSPTGIAVACGLTIEQAESSAVAGRPSPWPISSGELWTVPSALRPALVSCLPGEEIQSAIEKQPAFSRAWPRPGIQESWASRGSMSCWRPGALYAAEDWQAAAATTGRISSYLRGGAL